MKIRLASAIAVMALFGFGTANAADMPVKSRPVAAPVAYAAPAYNWTGYYIGALAGYGTGDSKHCDAGCFPGFPTPSIDGWLLGGTIGANWQTGNWVLGIEADAAWANIKGSSGNTSNFGCANACRTEINSTSTVRGRVGWAFDRWLPYLTAGVAFSDLHASLGNPVLTSDSSFRTSFVVGGGVEWAFTQQWSAKFEYLYTDMGGFYYDTNNTCGAFPNCSVEDVKLHQFRLGLNYKFL
jgi:outer membrane immunogenic protein